MKAINLILEGLHEGSSGYEIKHENQHYVVYKDGKAVSHEDSYTDAQKEVKKLQEEIKKSQESKKVYRVFYSILQKKSDNFEFRSEKIKAVSEDEALKIFKTKHKKDIIRDEYTSVELDNPRGE